MKLNEPGTAVACGYPKEITDVFPLLPSYLDAAVNWNNGKTYFFKVTYSIATVCSGYFHILSYLFECCTWLLFVCASIRYSHSRKGTRMRKCSHLYQVQVHGYWSQYVEVKSEVICIPNTEAFHNYRIGSEMCMWNVNLFNMSAGHLDFKMSVTHMSIDNSMSSKWLRVTRLSTADIARQPTISLNSKNWSVGITYVCLPNIPIHIFLYL